jgi:outer membrane receptor for ferrienterochelin and colicins
MNKLILVFFCPIICFSQTETDTTLMLSELEEIIISATMSERDLDKLPIPTTIISEKEIMLSNASKLYDVINIQTGIISVPTKTGTEGLQMQGLDASYITILVDGFPIIGRSFGALDLNRISLTDIERIEIIKGASSSLYGSNAIGGVVNLISKKQINDGDKINLSLKYASHNTLNPSLIYQYKKGSFQISNSIDYYNTDGYDLIESDLLSTVNPYSNFTFNTKLRYGLSDKVILNTNARYYNHEQKNTAEHEGSLLEGKTNIKEWNLGTSVKYLMNSNLFQQAEIYRTNYRADEYLNTEGGALYEDNYFDHTLLKSEIKTHFTYKKLNSILGFGMKKEELSRTNFSHNPKQDLKFIYTQLDATAFRKFNIIVGSRYDNYTDYTPVISNKLAVGFPLKKKININSSIGTGFKIPDFRQRYLDFTNSTFGYIVLGRDVAFDRLESMQNNGMIQEQEIFIPFSDFDSPLKSQTSLNINIGLKYNPTNNLFFDLNFFNNKVNDLIEWQLVAKDENNINIYSYFNVNQVETKGLEFNSTYTKTDNWEIKFGYQLLYAYDTEVKRRFEEETIYARDQETNVSFKLNKDDYFGLFNRSRHMGNIKLNYHLNKKTDLNAMLTYRSKYALSDSNANGFLDTYDEFIDGYSLCDLGVAHQISALKSCQIGIKNIFGFTNPEYISNISGRIYYININLNLK